MQPDTPWGGSDRALSQFWAAKVRATSAAQLSRSASLAHTTERWPPVWSTRNELRSLPRALGQSTVGEALGSLLLLFGLFGTGPTCGHLLGFVGSANDLGVFRAVLGVVCSAGNNLVAGLCAS